MRKHFDVVIIYLIMIVCALTIVFLNISGRLMNDSPQEEALEGIIEKATGHKFDLSPEP